MSLLKCGGLFLMLLGSVAIAPRASGGAIDAHVYSIADFGAVADGKAMNTDAIRSAIEACAKAGGGRVLIPPGTYLTGPIELKSDIDLHVAHGATVLFSRNLNDYPLAKATKELDGDTARRCSPLWGNELHDVAITGDGAFDGQGDAWRPLKKGKLNEQRWNELLKSRGTLDATTNTWYPPRPILRADGTASDQMEGPHDIARPTLVELSNCRKVLLDGPTFRNSPGWNVHLALSDDVTVRGITCFNEAYAQNGDSLDIESCRNVVIANCTLAGGDDVICLKSGKDEAGRQRGRPTENVFITNCTIGSGHGGIVIGSEMSGGVRNVTATNCVMKGTDAGLRFKTLRGRGGVVENINISNIDMTDIAGPAILFDMYYQQKPPQATSQPVDDGTPQFRQFQISNIRCTGAKMALAIRGLPEMPLDGISIQNATLKADSAGHLIDSNHISLRDVRIDAPDRLHVENVSNLSAERVEGLPQP